MLWFIYNVLFAIGYFVLLPKFLWHMQKRGGYAADFGQRLGYYRPPTRAKFRAVPRIWIHSVSVGEIYVALRFIRQLKGVYPQAQFVLTCTTPTAHRIAEKELPPEDVLLYFPVDFVPVLRRALRLIQPALLILVEGEYWPNLIRQTRLRRIPVVLVNGRLSDKSFRGYMRLRPFARRIFRQMDGLLMQSRADADKLLRLGAPEKLVQVTGNAKYEMSGRSPEAEAQLRAVLARAGIGAERRLLLGGSTWAGEEEILLALYKELKPLCPPLALVLAPRHAERAPDVLRALESAGVRYRRRSEVPAAGPAGAEAPDVILLDTTGELKNLYAAADVIFIGKSLTQSGGQNPIEPAICAKPVIVGPHMENFRAILEDFMAANAILQVPDAAGLKAAVKRLLDQPEDAAALGRRAAALVESRAGAIAASVAWIHGHIVLHGAGGPGERDER